MRNKLKMILLGVFCAGVLITGIGVGIAVIEYTQLEYTGVHVIGGENIAEAKYEFELELAEDETFYVENWNGKVDIVYDATIPENQVQCSIRYNAALTEISAVMMSESHQDIRLCFPKRYIADDFDLLMQNKDLIIAELKNNQIGSYSLAEPVESITVRVNPKLTDRIEMGNWW